MMVLVIWQIVAFSPQATAGSFADKMKALEMKISGRIGVSALVAEGKFNLNYKADERFPLMSTFKTLACAKMLYDIDLGLLSENHTDTVEKFKLVDWSPVTEKMVGQKITISAACQHTMLTSDNTAANLVLANIGGPTAVTGFLRQFGDDYTRLDRYEPDLNEARPGDLRDTTTPAAMTRTLQSLLLGQTLEPQSRAQLQKWMMENTVSNSLLRSILPEGWTIADRSGSGYHGSRGITAIIWPNQSQPLVVSIYLTETDLSVDDRSQVIVEIGQEIFKAYNMELHGKAF